MFCKSRGAQVNASRRKSVSRHRGETRELGTAMQAPGSGERGDLPSWGLKVVQGMRGSARVSRLGGKVGTWLSLLLASSSPPLLRWNSGEVDASALGGKERSSYWWSNKCSRDFGRLNVSCWKEGAI